MKLKHRFKIRCSAIGQIMSDPKEKSPKQIYEEKLEQVKKINFDMSEMERNNKTALKTYSNLQEKYKICMAELPQLKANSERIFLSKTCISYIHKWIKEQPEFYGRSTSFRSKYTDKGNACEWDSIQFAAEYYGWGLVKKNEEWKSNEFITGIPDVILPESIEDIKNSWHQDTFPLFDTEIPIDGYGWQLQGYMELFSKPKAGLIYTLMDAPEFLIDREARRRQFELGMEDLEADLYDEVKESMTYSMFPDEIRIKRFFLDRDKPKIERVCERVELIRNYIDKL